MAVYCDGAVIVTTPYHCGVSSAERFVREKIDWLLKKLEFFTPFRKRPARRRTKVEYRQNKERAYRLALERIEHFNRSYNFNFNSVNIRNQKTRWGSCSKKGNLNFNYKIALLPERLSDYIIVHELCHLGEFNHSKKFWRLVTKTMPDHANLRKELKKISAVQ
ncbi:MAG: M48 family metallopeptidase [bacterium]|nr:M48 family metallopeptidase [bacterium]